MAIEKEKNVLVHYQVGVRRSPTFVITYLMKYFGVSLEQAYD